MEHPHACAGWLAVGICIVMGSGVLFGIFLVGAAPLLFWYGVSGWLVMFF